MTRGRGITRGRVAAAVVGLGIAATAFTIAAPSRASFPGTNGLIAYVSATDVFVVNPSNPIPTQITNTGGYAQMNYNAAGNKLVASRAGLGLVLLDPVAGSAVTIVPNSLGTDSSPAFDPTGSKIAFVNANNLFTIDVAGTNRTTIATGAADPDWSPDGSFIAFGLPTNDFIRRVSPTGGNATDIAKTGPGGIACGAAAQCQAPSVSPDGKKVAFTQINNAAGGIGVANADGSTLTPTRITQASGHTRPAYSPDGTKIAFANGGGNVLSTVPTDGSGTVTTVGAPTNAGDHSWGVAAGTGTGTGSGTGPAAVINVSAVRNGKNCTFSIDATPAGPGITVDHQVTNGKGTKIKQTGDDVAVPATVTEKSKRKRVITLSDPKGATLGTATATCAKKRSRRPSVAAFGPREHVLGAEPFAARSEGAGRR